MSMIIDISSYIDPVAYGIDGVIIIVFLWQWSKAMKKQEGERFKRKRVR